MIEDAAQAFGAPGVAQHGHRLDVQLLSRRRTSSASATAASSRSNDEELARAGAHARASTARATRSTSTSSATTRASTSCRPRSFASSSRSSTSGTAAAAKPPRATPSSGSASSCELPADEPGHIYHLFVCRSPERDRIRAALVEAGIGTATYYTTPLHLQPALRFLGYEPGSLPETERAAAENFSVPLWPGMPRRACRSASSTSSARPSASAARRMTGFGRHRLSRQLRRRRGHRRAVVVPRVPAPLRPGPAPSTTTRCCARRSSLVVAIKLAVFVRVRLPPALVALRVDPRHVARGGAASRSHRCSRSRPSTSSTPSNGCGCRVGSRVDRPAAALAFVAGSRLLARTVIERPQRRDRRARQEGAHRRRRRRRPADRAGDPALAGRLLDAGRASSTTTRASAGCASSACGCSARPTTCRTSCASNQPGRGADRGPVRAGRVRGADRRDGERGATCP